MEYRIKDIFFRLLKRYGIILDQMVLSGGNFLLVIALARLWGVSRFGHFALAWMAVLFALSLHQAFVTQPMFTLLGKQSEGDRKAWLGVLLWLHLPVGVILVAVGGIIGLLGRWGMLSQVWVYIGVTTAVFTPVYLLQEFLRKAAFAERQIIRPLLADVCCFVLLVIGLGILWWAGALGLVAVFGVWSAAILMSLVWMCPIAERFVQACGPLSGVRRCSRRVLSAHYAFSKWLVGKALLQWLSGNAFIIAAASVLGPAAAGAVRIAQNILGLTHVLFLALESIIPLRASYHLHRNGLNAFLHYMHAQAVRYGGLTLIILAGLALWARPIVSLLYGHGAAAWAWVVQGYCGLYVLVFATLMAQFVIRTFEHTRPIFWGYAASATFSLFAATLMVQWWQMPGVLAGLILSQFIPLAIYLLAIRKKIRSLRPDVAPADTSLARVGVHVEGSRA